MPWVSNTDYNWFYSVWKSLKSTVVGINFGFFFFYSTEVTQNSPESLNSTIQVSVFDNNIKIVSKKKLNTVTEA